MGYGTTCHVYLSAGSIMFSDHVCSTDVIRFLEFVYMV